MCSLLTVQIATKENMEAVNMSYLDLRKFCDPSGDENANLDNIEKNEPSFIDPLS